MDTFLAVLILAFPFAAYWVTGRVLRRKFRRSTA